MQFSAIAATALAGVASLASVDLPEPRLTGSMSLEETLAARRSVREFRSQPLGLTEVSQLLWSAQGVSGSGGLRTAPSAGALYPLEILLIAARVDGLAPGLYRYEPRKHRLERVEEDDLRNALFAAALRQEAIRDAPAILVISAVFARTKAKYGERGVRYGMIEAGHAAQNVCLQATALGLGAVTIGAFHDARVAKILRLGKNEAPLYVIPVGRPAR